MDFPLSSGRIGYYEELLALENKFQKSEPFITVLKKTDTNIPILENLVSVFSFFNKDFKIRL